MDFNEVKYMHIERWNTDEVQHLKTCSELYIQPKLDGTNGVILFDNGIKFGSRNRFIDLSNDNQDFVKTMSGTELYNKLNTIFSCNPHWILYGEFLINHTFRPKQEYLKKFVIFDIFDTEKDCFLNFLENDCAIERTLACLGLDFMPSIKIDPSELQDEESFKEKYKDFGRFLIDDSFSTGEGFVIKNYTVKNKYGRICFAKVLNEKPKTVPNPNKASLFEKVRMNFFTDAWIEKETIKFLSREVFHHEKYINILTNEFIKEEIANIIIKYHYPVIDFNVFKSKLRKILLDFIYTRPNKFFDDRIVFLKNSFQTGLVTDEEKCNKAISALEKLKK